MAELQAALPQLMLTGGMSIVFEALDPTTGAAVTGVQVSQVAIYGNTAAEDESASSPVVVSLPDTTPLWAPLPAEIP